MAMKKAVKSKDGAVKKTTAKSVIKKAKKVVVKKEKTKKATTNNKKTLQDEKITINTANPQAYVVIDYPYESEMISGSEYVIKIGASKDGYVEISFNDSEWKPCRFASGYWWFDWKYFQPGKFKIVARLLNSDNKVIKISDTRVCKVK